MKGLLRWWGETLRFIFRSLEKEGEGGYWGGCIVV